MSYFKVCPYCGSHLDPGEKCDCGQKEAAVSAANADNGKAERGLHTNFSIYQNNRNYGRFQA